MGAVGGGFASVGVPGGALLGAGGDEYRGKGILLAFPEECAPLAAPNGFKTIWLAPSQMSRSQLSPTLSGKGTAAPGAET